MIEKAQVSEKAPFVSLVNAEISARLQQLESQLSEISADSVQLVQSISDLAQGGKRMRATLAYWGWRGAEGRAATADSLITATGAALELFQTAALIHDDIIDRSDTRRGQASTYRQFANFHQENRWSADSEHFGHSTAILSGDLCLSLSEEVFASVLETPEGSELFGRYGAQWFARARGIFNQMRMEVMAGQYLDLLEEVKPFNTDSSAVISQALTILRFKSAKYSCEHPVVLGGALAGASEELLTGYSAFALPLGEAFQLRDDLLGVFGDPAQTGKPAGDDLREGKRTVLLGYALERCSAAEQELLSTRLGAADLSDQEVEDLRGIMRDSGAMSRTEALIEELAAESDSKLRSLPISAEAMASFEAITRAAVARVS